MNQTSIKKRSRKQCRSPCRVKKHKLSIHRHKLLKDKKNSYVYQQIFKQYRTTIYPRITSPKINRRRPPTPNFAERTHPLRHKRNRRKLKKVQSRNYNPKLKKDHHVRSKSMKSPPMLSKIKAKNPRNKLPMPLQTINFQVTIPKSSQNCTLSLPKNRHNYEMISFRKNNICPPINIKPSTPLKYRNRPVPIVIEVKPFIQVSPCIPRNYCKPFVKRSKLNH